MLRKEDCIKALERRIAVLASGVIETIEAEQRFYTRTIGIIWFLEEMGLLTRVEAIWWLDELAEADLKAWTKIQEWGKN